MAETSETPEFDQTMLAFLHRHDIEERLDEDQFDIFYAALVTRETKRDAAIASAARREERARLRQVREDIIEHLAGLVRIPTAPTLYNERDLVDRESVITIAMRLKKLVDDISESEAPRRVCMCQARLPSPPGVCEKCGGEFGLESEAP